jgi:Flp pilus assembly protein TadB
MGHAGQLGSANAAVPRMRQAEVARLRRAMLLQSGRRVMEFLLIAVAVAAGLVVLVLLGLGIWVMGNTMLLAWYMRKQKQEQEKLWDD